MRPAIRPTVSLSPAVAPLPEHDRLITALAIELEATGHLAPRSIWSLTLGRPLSVEAQNGHHYVNFATQQALCGWWPPIAIGTANALISPAEALAALQAAAGGALRWWCRDPLSGALRALDAPDRHAPLDSLAADRSRPGTSGWRALDSGVVLAFCWSEGGDEGVLEAHFGAPPPPQTWEDLRRGAEWLGASQRLAGERARLERDRRYLGTVLDLIHDGVIAGAEDGEVVLYTPQLQGLVGWHHSEINNGAWMHRVYPDPSYRTRMIAHIRSHFNDTQFDDHAVELATRSGDTVLCELRTSQTVDEHGRVVAFGAFRDATAARAAAGQQQQQANINAMGHIAATIAHDFRNLLGLVTGYAAVIAAQTQGDVAARADRIRAAAERGESLARRLLSFGSARPVRLTPVDLNVELKRAAALFAGPKGEPTLRSPPGPVWARADINLLHDVLDNLILNGVTAQGGEVGGLSLSLEAAPLPPRVSFAAAEVAGEMVRVRVMDTGPGFSADARAHLFQPFYSTRTGGHGLGLASVRQLIGLMWGAIDIPELPEGAQACGVIDIYLPASATPGDEHAPTPESAPRGTERVWALDDEPDIGEIVSFMLGDLGYEVRTFCEPDAFLSAIGSDADPPDLIMLDLHMGAHSGLSVLAELRARGLRQPVLLCTGGIPPALSDPRARVLEKPFDQLQLGSAVRGLIDSMVFGPEPGRRRRAQR